MNTADQVGISKVTHYVVLTLKGDPIMSVVKGEPFTDPGADALENGATTTYTVSGTVDNTTTGLYTLTYTAVNKDGFSSSVSRTVVVIPAHETPGVDISGSYDYVGSSTFTATISWSGGTVIPVTFICLDGVAIDVPEQTTAYGPVFGTGTLNNTGKLVYIMSIPNFAISNSTRTWQKQ